MLGGKVRTDLMVWYHLTVIAKTGEPREVLKVWRLEKPSKNLRDSYIPEKIHSWDFMGN